MTVDLVKCSELTPVSVSNGATEMITLLVVTVLIAVAVVAVPIAVVVVVAVAVVGEIMQEPKWHSVGGAR